MAMGFLLRGELLLAVEIIVSPDATELALFYSSPLCLFGEGR
jgi:hypothetical protein